MKEPGTDVEIHVETNEFPFKQWNFVLVLEGCQYSTIGSRSSRISPVATVKVYLNIPLPWWSFLVRWRRVTKPSLWTQQKVNV